MPLISDATNIMVGGTEISRVYAGAVKVWEKVLPSTDQVIIGNYVYAVWPYEFKDCPSVSTDWWFRIGYDTNNSGTVGWQEWYTPGEAPGWWFYSPQHKRMCMGNAFSRQDDTIVDMLWYQVYDRRKSQTILTMKCDRAAPVYPMPTDIIDCNGPLPIDAQIQTQLPTDPVLRRTFVTWPNTQSISACGQLAWQNYWVATGISESPDGLTEPLYWSSKQRLDAVNFKMIWPTYNAVLWSPDAANSGEEGNITRRLWFRVYHPLNTDVLIPPTRLNQSPNFYPYPSGDGILC